jgi:polar amino acid transport system substrate-binding protein
MKAFRILVSVAIAALLAGACASPSDRATRRSIDALPEPTTPPQPEEVQPEEPCEPEASFRPGPLPPPGAMPVGSSMREIQDRGLLIAAVDENTLPLSFRNPATGEIEGFEIDLVRELARAILGDPSAVQLVTVTTKQKIDFPEQGLVDLTASAVSINCDRWQRVSFSTPYYRTYQQLMVRDDSEFHELSDLADRRVCMTIGSTSVAVLERELPDAIDHQVETRTDCLVDLQDGDADAIFTHRTFLDGFAQQDPRTRILDRQLSEQLYGIAVNRDREDLVRFVNGVLEQLRANGFLAERAAFWLRSDQPIPDARYRD